jgi:hypothetical protein
MDKLLNADRVQKLAARRAAYADIVEKLHVTRTGVQQMTTAIDDVEKRLARLEAQVRPDGLTIVHEPVRMMTPGEAREIIEKLVG